MFYTFKLKAKRKERIIKAVSEVVTNKGTDPGFMAIFFELYF